MAFLFALGLFDFYFFFLAAEKLQSHSYMRISRIKHLHRMKENGRTTLLPQVPWEAFAFPFHRGYGTFFTQMVRNLFPGFHDRICSSLLLSAKNICEFDLYVEREALLSF